MLLNDRDEVFVGQRLDSTLEAWQMPQGGIDAGEDPGEAALQLGGAHQRWQCQRHVVEDACRRTGCLACAFGGLERLPVARLRLGIPDVLIAEHMGVSADHFEQDALDHIAKRKSAALIGHLRVIDDLEQQIAKLVSQRGEVVARDRVRDLVGFLDGVWRDRAEVLLDIPRTAADRRAQFRHQGQQRADFSGRGAVAKAFKGRLERGGRRRFGYFGHIYLSHNIYYGKSLGDCSLTRQSRVTGQKTLESDFGRCVFSVPGILISAAGR